MKNRKPKAILIDPKEERSRTRTSANWILQHTAVVSWKFQFVPVKSKSTGVCRVLIYSALEEARFQIVLANPRQVKAIPGRKTDQADSEWLAYLLRAELIKPHPRTEAKVATIINQIEDTTHPRRIVLQEPRPQDTSTMQ